MNGGLKIQASQAQKITELANSQESARGQVERATYGSDKHTSAVAILAMARGALQDYLDSITYKADV